VYRIGDYDAGREPLLDNPISVGNRVRVAGEVSNEYLCQFLNNENRAFLDLFSSEHVDEVFPAKTFSVKQDADGMWVHSSRGKSLTDFYDFVLVRQFTPPKSAAAAARAASKKPR
jgi:hypothetical protein